MKAELFEHQTLRACRNRRPERFCFSGNRLLRFTPGIILLVSLVLIPPTGQAEPFAPLEGGHKNVTYPYSWVRDIVLVDGQVWIRVVDAMISATYSHTFYGSKAGNFYQVNEGGDFEPALPLKDGEFVISSHQNERDTLFLIQGPAQKRILNQEGKDLGAPDFWGPGLIASSKEHGIFFAASAGKLLHYANGKTTSYNVVYPSRPPEFWKYEKVIADDVEIAGDKLYLLYSKGEFEGAVVCIDLASPEGNLSAVDMELDRKALSGFVRNLTDWDFGLTPIEIVKDDASLYISFNMAHMDINDGLLLRHDLGNLKNTILYANCRVRSGDQRATVAIVPGLEGIGRLPVDRVAVSKTRIAFSETTGGVYSYEENRWKKLGQEKAQYPFVYQSALAFDGDDLLIGTTRPSIIRVHEKEMRETLIDLDALALKPAGRE